MAKVYRPPSAGASLSVRSWGKGWLRAFAYSCIGLLSSLWFWYELIEKYRI